MGHRLLYSIQAPSTELNVGVENLLEAVMNYTTTVALFFFLLSLLSSSSFLFTSNGVLEGRGA